MNIGSGQGEDSCLTEREGRLDASMSSYSFRDEQKLSNRKSSSTIKSIFMWWTESINWKKKLVRICGNNPEIHRGRMFWDRVEMSIKAPLGHGLCVGVCRCRKRSRASHAVECSAHYPKCIRNVRTVWLAWAHELEDCLSANKGGEGMQSI